MDALGGMVRKGVSLTRCLELAVQWDCILRAGPVHPVSLDDLLRVVNGGIGWFHEVVEGLRVHPSGGCLSEG